MARPVPLARAALLAAILALPGCYAYHPTTLATVTPGTEVRATLDDEGARRVEDYTGHRATTVAGSFLRRDGDAVLFEVWRTDLGNGIVFQPGRTQVELLQRNVLDVASRDLSWGRTAALVGGVVGGVWLLVKGIWHGSGGSIGQPGGGNGI